MMAAAAFADKFSCAAASSLEDALKDADFAVVMGRPFEIADRGLAVMQAGIPLLIEKPIGISAAASEPLLPRLNATRPLSPWRCRMGWA